MILQEKIKKKSEGYGKLAPTFLEGAEFALKEQWINVNDKMPYEYPELLINQDTTVPVLTKTERLGYFVQPMLYTPAQGWRFNRGAGVGYWMPIPELPKNRGLGYEDNKGRIN